MHHYRVHGRHFYLCTGRNHSNGEHEESFKVITGQRLVFETYQMRIQQDKS